MINNGVDLAITNHLRIVVAVLALAAALLMLVATDEPAEAAFPGQKDLIPSTCV